MHQQLETMKKKDLRKEYQAFVGDDKADYYLKKFDKLQSGGSKISLNFAALFCSTYWLFYRKLFGLGAIALVMNFGGLYLNLMMPRFAVIGGILSIVPAVVCGLFGNYCYLHYVEKNIAQALDMTPDAKAKLYADNGGSSARIVLGILAAFVFFGMALFFSAGPQAIEQMVDNTQGLAP